MAGDFDHVYALTRAGVSAAPEIAALVISSCDAPFSVVDRLAIDVATRYQEGALSSSHADLIMNQVFSCMAVPETLDFISRSIAYQVYLAFDAGEYEHPHDGPEVDPQSKYTRPLVAHLLKNRLRGWPGAGVPGILF